MANDNTPLRPARAGLAEVVFLSEWQALLKKHPVLSDLLDGKKTTKRDAQVAASFITWLGTNSGAAFVHAADQMVQTLQSSESGYLAAWALINRRQWHINSGVRTIESVLALCNLFDKRNVGIAPHIAAQDVEISIDDIDTVEALVVWISTAQGRAFVKNCTALWMVKCERERLHHDVKFNQSING